MLRDIIRSCYSPLFYRHAVRSSWSHTFAFFGKLVMVSAVIQTLVVLGPAMSGLWSMDPQPFSKFVASEMPDDMTVTFNSNPRLPFLTVNRDVPYVVPGPSWLSLPYVPSSIQKSGTSANLLLITRNSDVLQKAKQWIDVCLQSNALFVLMDSGVLTCHYLFVYTNEEMRALRNAALTQRTNAAQGVEYRLMTEVVVQFHRVPHVEVAVTMTKNDILDSIRDTENTPFMQFLLRYKGFMMLTLGFAFWMAAAWTAACYINTMFFVLSFLIAPIAFCNALGPLGRWYSISNLIRVSIYALAFPTLLDFLFLWEPPNVLLSRNIGAVVYGAWLTFVIRYFLARFDPATPDPVPPPRQVASLRQPAHITSSTPPTPAHPPQSTPKPSSVVKKRRAPKPLFTGNVPTFPMPFPNLPLPPFPLPSPTPFFTSSPPAPPFVPFPLPGLPPHSWPLPLLPFPVFGIGLPGPLPPYFPSVPINTWPNVPLPPMHTFTAPTPAP